MDTIKVALTRGMFATVSEADAGMVMNHRWHAVKTPRTFYAARRVGTKTIYMHRLVLGIVDAPREVFVDHINHDGLDNTRENLRLSDAKANAQNRRYMSDYLGLRGVRENEGRWEAQIRVDGALIFLGSFPCQREAGIAYAAACRALGRK